MASKSAPLLQTAINLHRSGRSAEAERAYVAVLRVEPTNPIALNNLSVVLLARGAVQKALALSRKAVRSSPLSPQAHCNLGNALSRINSAEEAILSYERALQLDPNMIAARRNLAGALLSLGRASKAAKCFEQVIAAEPQLAAGYRGLGDACLGLAMPQAAMENYRRAVELDPSSVRTRSNFLMSLNYSLDISAGRIRELHETWAVLRGSSRPQVRFKRAELDGRRVRVGYVSPDFRRHSVAYFIAPLLAAHDARRFEIFCYSDVGAPDDFTRQLRGRSEHWTSIHGLADERVADQIREDKIDILVDLAGHTANNRIQLFACKPAPLQVSWLGYPNTTGLQTIDYRITDTIADPDAVSDPFYTERLIRLPRCFLSYTPLDETPTQGRLPANGTGQITFGSFSDLNKVNARVIALWANLLCQIPDATLLLKARQLGEPEVRERIKAEFGALGIDRKRIVTMEHLPTQRQHLDAYAEVDIALDSFPYNGATTTCEALWMGVPVITLRGNQHAGRVGASILTAAGLPELIASDPDEYVSIAYRLAQDHKQLADLRHDLRTRISGSSLCDGGAFARAMESAYLEIWRRQCGSPENLAGEL